MVIIGMIVLSDFTNHHHITHSFEAVSSIIIYNIMIFEFISNQNVLLYLP